MLLVSEPRLCPTNQRFHFVFCCGFHFVDFFLSECFFSAFKRRIDWFDRFVDCGGELGVAARTFALFSWNQFSHSLNWSCVDCICWKLSRFSFWSERDAVGERPRFSGKSNSFCYFFLVGLILLFDQISYSLYLYHWPLIVFVTYTGVHVHPLLLFVILLALSIASYYVVEGLFLFSSTFLFLTPMSFSDWSKKQSFRFALWLLMIRLVLLLCVLLFASNVRLLNYSSSISSVKSNTSASTVLVINNMMEKVGSLEKKLDPIITEKTSLTEPPSTSIDGKSPSGLNATSFNVSSCACSAFSQQAMVFSG